MPVVVQKYGGTSVADPERITRVADRIRETREKGNDVVVVVSAMGHTTDELLELAAQVSDNPPRRELDMLLSTGERISMALLAMALEARGVPAVSYTGSQAGVLTNSMHGEARITKITGERVRQSLEEGKVVIVAGFQGVDPVTKEITTLGRGGSDATAVALAASLGADHVEIYTDVDGVYTADPRIVPVAQKLDELGFDEMLEMAASGAGVLMTRSVEIGRRYDLPIHVRSSFHDGEGTWVRDSEVMEQAIVSGIAHDRSEVRFTVSGVPNRPGIAARLFGALADARIVVDTIVQNIAHDGTADISFTVPKAAVAEAERITKEVGDELGATVELDHGIGKVSIIGAGMKSQPGVAALMFRTLAGLGIDIEMISTSTIRITCVIRADRIDEAVAALHEAFGLQDGPNRQEGES
ncbi:MAG: aspartate kinase [Actinomycetes bacterium]|jgi:aspartate kinase|nr:MAG: aspartate kinase [Actinomycetota bacterium]